MPKLTIYDTKLKRKQLIKLVLGLYRDASGWNGGINVKEDPGFPNGYFIERHRGTITDSCGRVRVVQNQIWTGSESALISSTLVANKISHTVSYEDIPEAELKNLTPRPITKEGLEYTVSFHK